MGRNIRFGTESLIYPAPCNASLIGIKAMLNLLVSKKRNLLMLFVFKMPMCSIAGAGLVDILASHILKRLCRLVKTKILSNEIH